MRRETGSDLTAGTVSWPGKCHGFFVHPIGGVSEVQKSRQGGIREVPMIERLHPPMDLPVPVPCNFTKLRIDRGSLWKMCLGALRAVRATSYRSARPRCGERNRTCLWGGYRLHPLVVMFVTFLGVGVGQVVVRGVGHVVWWWLAPPPGPGHLPSVELRTIALVSRFAIGQPDLEGLIDHGGINYLATDRANDGLACNRLPLSLTPRADSRSYAHALKLWVMMRLGDSWMD